MVEIRGAEPWDLAACAALIVSHEGGDEREWHERFAAALSREDHLMLVAVDDRNVVGYGHVRYQRGNPVRAEPAQPDGWYLSGVVVAVDYRRSGIGLALCEARVAWVTERAVEVWFFTNVRNVRSRELHKKAGFQEVSVFRSPELDGGEGVLGHRTTTVRRAS